MDDDEDWELPPDVVHALSQSVLPYLSNLPPALLSPTSGPFAGPHGPISQDGCRKIVTMYQGEKWRG